MEIFALYFFLLGLCIGSFLNVVIYRYNTGMTLTGRSQCFSCGTQLAWYDLIPLVSFISNRGKCRRCESRISRQYPAVELLVGCIFLALWYLNGLTPILLIDLFLWSVLVVILVYDLKHKIIPDSFVFGAIILAYTRTLALIPFGDWFTVHTVLLLSAGPLLFIPFWALWYISQGRWIGLGDGKLAIVIGALLGPALGISAVALSFWLGAGVMLVLIGVQWVIKKIQTQRRLSFLKNKLTMKSEIPFAPFMIGALWIVFYFQINVLLVGLLFV